MLSVANGLEQFMDPRWLQPGQRIAYLLTPAAEGDARLRVLSIQRGIDSKIIISRTGEEEFRARVESIPHEREIVGARFRIGASLYGSAAAAGVPEAVLLSAYRQLSHRLDFQRDLRQGDRVTIAFERFSHGESGPVHPGAMVATTIEQQHRRFAVYRFTSSDGESAYYNQQGVSMETALSRTPVRGGRLSSLFGRRDHPVLGYTRMHKGMDFAAPLGAAVVAAGDGTIVRMSRYGSFGKYVRIRHHSGLSTAYAHLSRYAKNLSKGAKVKQGEVIGYVGATGLATGPNLHYEVLRDGQQVDPRELDLPPRRILEGKSLAEFQEQVRRLSTGLENSPRATIATLTP
jgi:murein DD-endopeptidase MepM/ murein hydrolase activator NlpD